MKKLVPERIRKLIPEVQKACRVGNSHHGIVSRSIGKIAKLFEKECPGLYDEVYRWEKEQLIPPGAKHVFVKEGEEKKYDW